MPSQTALREKAERKLARVISPRVQPVLKEGSVFYFLDGNRQDRFIMPGKPAEGIDASLVARKLAPDGTYDPKGRVVFFKLSTRQVVVVGQMRRTYVPVSEE